MSSKAGGATLVLLAHPVLERSRVNRALVATVRDLPAVTVRDLYELYPDFDIDVRREQELLTQHDVVVFQHPFYWYSCPALLKQWLDLVLEHDWAYGARGRALEGKWALAAVTTGGRELAYGPEGLNRFTMAELLRPLEQTVRLCRMRWLPPFVVHGTHRITPDGIDSAARDYRRLLEALSTGGLETTRLDAVDSQSRINLDLDRLLGDIPGEG